LTNREEEIALLRCIEAGDNAAKAILFERCQGVIKRLADRYAEPDTPAHDEMLAQSDLWLDKALAAYRWQDSRENGGVGGVLSFSGYAEIYCQYHPSALAKREIKRTSTRNIDAVAEEPSTGRRRFAGLDDEDGRARFFDFLYDGGAVAEEISNDDLPHFLNPRITHVCRLLAKGHTHEEVIALTGLTVAQFKRAVVLIRAKLGLGDLPTQVDPKAAAAYQERLAAVAAAKLDTKEVQAR
jgi:hypothetical protein